MGNYQDSIYTHYNVNIVALCYNPIGDDIKPTHFQKPLSSLSKRGGSSCHNHLCMYNWKVNSAISVVHLLVKKHRG